MKRERLNVVAVSVRKMPETRSVRLRKGSERERERKKENWV